MRFIGLPEDIQLDPVKIQAMSSFPLPKTVKDLRKFLDMSNFYHRFSTKATHHQSILNAYCSGPNTKESHLIAWSTDALQAFKTIKQQLVDATFLAFPQQKSLLALFFRCLPPRRSSPKDELDLIGCQKTVFSKSWRLFPEPSPLCARSVSLLFLKTVLKLKKSLF